MSLDGLARRSNIDASAEPAVKRLLLDGETALMRAAARGDVDEIRRHLDERRGETPVAGLACVCYAERLQGSGRGPP